MRIDLIVRVPDTPDSGPTKANARAAEASSSLAADTAKLWTDHNRVAALSAKVNHLPEIRQEKVAALAKKVREGSYQTTPEQTAAAMIGHLVIAPLA